jgi:hypothetical protein
LEMSYQRSLNSSPTLLPLIDCAGWLAHTPGIDGAEAPIQIRRIL